MKEIIIGRKGNQVTPITDPTVSRHHCKVTVADDGSMTIENLSGSGTSVDGVEIIRKSVSKDSIVGLGPSFRAPLSALLGSLAASDKPSSPPSKAPEAKTEPPKVTITHLRRVWEDYNNANLEIADKQRKINLVRTGLGIFTMCAMPTIFFLGPVGYVLTGVGVLGNIYSFAGMRNAETPAERQERQDQFDDAWVCPNPKCRRSLPARNYKLLVRNHQACPYCKAKYVE